MKSLNFTSKTSYEQHKANQEQFKQLMPLLSGLNADDRQALIFKLKNDARSTDESLLAIATSQEQEIELAKLSEEENYKMKNWYKHDKDTLQWADKKRMKVDETKVRDMLRN